MGWGKVKISNPVKLESPKAALESAAKTIKTGRAGGALGDLGESTKTLFREGEVKGGVLRNISDEAKNLGGELKKNWDYFTKGAFGEKVGMGKYKPAAIDIDAGAFGQGTGAGGGSPTVAGWDDMIAGIEAREAPTAVGTTVAGVGDAATPTFDPATEFRMKQATLADQLAEQAAGRGPSLATEMLQDARDQQIAQAMALGASQRGLTAGQGLRGIQQQTQQAAQFAAREAAKARIAEQLAARQQLAGVAQGARALDVDEAKAEADLGARMNIANLQKDLQHAVAQGQITSGEARANLQAAVDTQAQQDAFLRDLERMKLQQEQFGAGQAMDLQKLKADIALRQQQMEAGAHKDWSERMGGFLGKLGEGFAAGGSKMLSGGTAAESGAAGLGALLPPVPPA